MSEVVPVKTGEDEERTPEEALAEEFAGYEPGPVSADDVIYAETVTTVGLRDNKDPRKIKALAEALAESLKRTKRHGQEIAGIDIVNSTKALTAEIKQRIEGILAENVSTDEAHEQPPESGAVQGKITGVYPIQGYMTVSPVETGGRVFYVPAERNVLCNLEPGGAVWVVPTKRAQGGHKPEARYCS